MRRENGYIIFDNLVHDQQLVVGDDAYIAPIKAKETAFTAANASADIRQVGTLEEVSEIAGVMGEKFTQAFAQP